MVDGGLLLEIVMALSSCCKSCKSKAKSYCELVCSRENVVRLTGRYVTRVVAAIVWCGVIWSLLGSSALPLQYFNNDENCIVLRNITIFENDSILPPDSLDGTFHILSYSKLSVLVSFFDNASNPLEYVQVEIRRSKQCENISVELQMINHNWTVPASATLDVDDIFSQEEEEGPGGLVDIPNGHFFALILLLIFSSVCGFFAKLIGLPPLFGMIIAGLLLRNVPYIDFARHIQPAWSSTIRNVALVIILIRGGLSMKPKDLKRLKHAVLILGSIPCVLEGAVDGVIAIVYLKMPWQWGLMLGYVGLKSYKVF